MYLFIVPFIFAIALEFTGPHDYDCLKAEVGSSAEVKQWSQTFETKRLNKSIWYVTLEDQSGSYRCYRRYKQVAETHEHIKEDRQILDQCKIWAGEQLCESGSRQCIEYTLQCLNDHEVVFRRLDRRGTAQPPSMECIQTELGKVYCLNGEVDRYF